MPGNKPLNGTFLVILEMHECYKSAKDVNKSLTLRPPYATVWLWLKSQ